MWVLLPISLGLPLKKTELEVVSRSPNETREIGRLLGEQAQPGQVFLLLGDLGAGKTCLTQGILWGLGAEDFARSPTFVMVAEHAYRLHVYHVDLYRLDRPLEVSEIGLDEYLGSDGLCIVEWADRAPDLLSTGFLQIRLSTVSEERRRIRFVDPIGDYNGLIEAVGAARYRAEE